MRLVICDICKRVIQIGGDHEEITYLLGNQDSYPCVTPLCRGRMTRTQPYAVPSGYRVSTLPINAFFRAIHGFGPGKGDPASLKRLRELMLSEKIVDLVAEPIGQPERVILRTIVLKNGTRIHLETSAKGACVYYIEEPSPSCLEVVENDISADTDLEGCDPDREKTRRATQAESEDSLRQASNSVVGDSAGAAELSNSRGMPSLPEAGGVLPHDV